MVVSCGSGREVVLSFYVVRTFGNCSMFQMFRSPQYHQLMGNGQTGTKSKAQVLIENTCDDCNFVLPGGPGFVRDNSTLPPGYESFAELGEEFRNRLFMRYNDHSIP